LHNLSFDPAAARAWSAQVAVWQIRRSRWSVCLHFCTTFAPEFRGKCKWKKRPTRRGLLY